MTISISYIVVIIVPQLFFINKIFLQSCLPFNLDKMINIKPKIISVRSFDQILVEIQVFSMKNSLFSPFLGIFHTMVILIIVGSLFKIPPLRSGGTSAQKKKKFKKKIERRPHEGTVQRSG